jgi:phosphatidylglycerol lysyltransferase
MARFALRAALSLTACALFVWLLADRWAQIDHGQLRAAFGQLTALQWGGALGLTAVSFWAVGHYDAVVHRHFATGLPDAMTRRAGICAIAVSQTLGLGLISGALIRWRMLPGVSLWQASRLTGAVALSFLAGWAVVTSLVLLVLPGAPFKGGAFAALCLAFAGIGVSLAAPQLHRIRFRWPNGQTLARLIGLCAVDTLFAAGALFVLFPTGLDLTFTALLPAFLLALGAGLALGTPGGMGAFEISLLALLPTVEVAPLLAAVLAWRVVYFVLPASAAALLAIARPKTMAVPATTLLARPQRSIAEHGLTRQGTLGLEPLGQSDWLCGRSGHCLITLLDPSPARSPQTLDLALDSLVHLARAEGRLPACYKASARLAARARKRGLACRRVGWQATLCPQTYRLATSARAGLRRKLRRAEAAGISAERAHPPRAPWAALDQIAASWARAHGGERGFSMGRYDRRYLEGQNLYIAWQNDRPIAFASFHTCAGEWTLDLMRQTAAAPDGTMHLLIQCAIDDAARAGISRLSLAAVPEAAMGARADRISRVITALAPQIASPGLFRFKQCFAPRWQPLFVIAPHTAGMALAGLSLWRAICRPRRIMHQIEQHDAQYEIALPPEPWHIPNTVQAV